MWTIPSVILFHKGGPQAVKATKGKPVHLKDVKSIETSMTF